MPYKIHGRNDVPEAVAGAATGVEMTLAVFVHKVRCEPELFRLFN